ncbi:MAG TPA: 23S rRNA (guanosine(2251)-2'-O)-methyltransferase RlmB [Massilibacterium sp.]|nr:23S rRNA (guanosine(2251)-2'-O)-methyltransferase RlmB [Massilibacterium sp.]
MEQGRNEEWIVGKNPVIEALKANRPINKILIAEGTQKGQVHKVKELAKKMKVVVQHVPKQKIDSLIGPVHGAMMHQGVVASVAPYSYASLDDLFMAAETKKEQPFFIILDEIEDPHNLGSIMRTADAAGAHGIIIPKRRSAQLTATVAKTSAGAIEYVPVCRVTNLVQTIEELKERGVWIVGTDASAKDDFRSLDGDMPIALVIGSEGKGVSRLVLKNCDFIYSLPMKGQVTSLNASVAASLLMYEVFRKRVSMRE